MPSPVENDQNQVVDNLATAEFPRRNYGGMYCAGERSSSFDGLQVEIIFYNLKF